MKLLLPLASAVTVAIAVACAVIALQWQPVNWVAAKTELNRLGLSAPVQEKSYILSCDWGAVASSRFRAFRYDGNMVVGTICQHWRWVPWRTHTISIMVEQVRA